MMSALAQLPSITAAFDSDEQVAILTANASSLEPMRPQIKRWCAVDPDEDRFVVVGCRDIEGFEAVEQVRIYVLNRGKHSDDSHIHACRAKK